MDARGDANFKHWLGCFCAALIVHLHRDSATGEIAQRCRWQFILAGGEDIAWTGDDAFEPFIGSAFDANFHLRFSAFLDGDGDDFGQNAAGQSLIDDGADDELIGAGDHADVVASAHEGADGARDLRRDPLPFNRAANFQCGDIAFESLDLLLQRVLLFGKAQGHTQFVVSAGLPGLCLHFQHLCLRHAKARLQFAILQTHEHRAIGCYFCAGLFHFNNLAIGAGVDEDEFFRLDDCFSARSIGEVNDANECDDEREESAGGDQCEGPCAIEFFTGEQVLDPLEDRHDDEADDGRGCQGQREEEEDALKDIHEIEHDADGDEHAVDAAEDCVNEEPESLATGVCGIARLAYAIDIAADEVLNIFLAALREIGHLEHVRQHVVAVVSKQRIGVKENGGDACDEDQVVANVMDERASLRIGPDDGGDGGDDQLDVHARSADHDALPFAAEGPGAGSIDIRHGHEDEEHDAHGVHFAA